MEALGHNLDHNLEQNLARNFEEVDEIVSGYFKEYASRFTADLLSASKGVECKQELMAFLHCEAMHCHGRAQLLQKAARNIFDANDASEVCLLD